MKVICVNDKGRPNEVPADKWVTKGERYTVAGVVKCNIQNGAVAYVLEEIDLTGHEPYIGFDSRRFGNSFQGIFADIELEEMEAG